MLRLPSANALLLALMLLLVPALAVPLVAQEDPALTAATLIRELTKRSTLPPIQAQAELEALQADVARELGQQIEEGDSDTSRMVSAYLAESNNSNAHAALLYSLASEKEEKKQLALDMLSQLEFHQVRELTQAADDLSPSLLTRVRKSDFMHLLEEYVADLCLRSGDYQGLEGSWDSLLESEGVQERTESLRERQLCLALLIDAVEGEGGFKILVDEILKHLVGEDVASFIADVEHRLSEIRKRQEEVETDEDAEEPEEEKPAVVEGEDIRPLSEAEQEKYARFKLIEQRRDGAQRMFRQLLLMDPDRSGRTLGNYSYEDRKASAEDWWPSYIRAFDEPTTWIAHLEYLRRPNEFAEGANWTTLLLMDELCGGVTITPPPPPESEEGEDIGVPVEEPIFTGTSSADKIANFRALSSSEQRARKKALRQRFNELFKAREE